MKIRFFLSIFLFLLIPEIQAKLIEPVELLGKVIEANRPVAQFRLIVSVKVYDPEASAPLGEDLMKETIPYELIREGFTQEIVWIRDEFLGIETLSNQGKPLHIYIQAEGMSISKNLTEERIFQDEDVFFHFAFFFTKHIPELQLELDNMGIDRSQTSYRHKNFRLFYQLGSDESSILLNPDLFRVEEIQRQVQIRGRYYPYRIQFGKWLKTKKKRIPGGVNYYIKDRLIKTVTAKSIIIRGLSAKRARLVKLYKKAVSAGWGFSLDTHYGN